MFVSRLSLALSVWSTYTQIRACQIMTDDMQQTAIDMANQQNEVEQIKLEKVDPLLSNVTNEVNMLRIYWWLLANSPFFGGAILYVKRREKSERCENNFQKPIAEINS